MRVRHVLIADDHEVTRRGIREILRDAFGELDSTEVSDGSAVLDLLGTPWDLFVLDVMMPGPGIVPLVSRIREAHPTASILVLTAATETEYVIQTMRAGASGVLHKHRASDELVRAVRAVCEGGHYLHAETAAAIASAVGDRDARPLHSKLSERELDIVCRIARGQAVKEIAADLGLSNKTVATYLMRVRGKTGLSSHVEITRYALRNGLVE